MEFIEYLKSKKINPTAFKEDQPDQYDEWLMLFDQVHPNSFTQQKLFLINKLRRKYKWEAPKEASKTSAPKMVKPKIKPLKPKTK